MIKISKYIWVFLGLFGALSALIVGAGEKYLPFLLHKTIYLCKHVISSTPIEPLQTNFRLITYSAVVILLSYIGYRLMATIYSIIKQKRDLTQKIIQSEKIDLLAKELGLQNKVLAVQDNQLLAFCFGVFNPKIYVSSKMVEQLCTSELEIVLRHEMYHLINKDMLVMTIARFGELLFPFLPVLSDITAKYSMQREVQADTFAHANTLSGKRDLISVLTQMLREEVVPAYAFASNLGEYETLEVRINLLLERHTSHPGYSSTNLLISLFSLIILSILFVTPVKAIEYHAQGQDAVMACIDPFGSCNNTCELNSIKSSSTQSVSHSYSSSSFSSSIY